MATFLNTRKAISEIEELIRNAGEKLLLISPYLKLSKDFRELLTYRNNKDKITTIIFRKSDLKTDELKFLQSQRFVILKHHEDLHAKCYVSDDKIIITSLNLYEYSMANNKEMGVLIDKNEPADLNLFESAMKEVEYISETSQKFDFTGSTTDEKRNLKGDNRIRGKVLSNGYCIRTGVEIPFNIEKPLCEEAYKKWKEHGDSDYPEKYCHFSGEKSNGKTSYNYPILKKNWKKAQKIHDLK